MIVLQKSWINDTLIFTSILIVPEKVKLMTHWSQLFYQ